MNDNKQKLTVDEVAKEICFWNTQIQLKPDNMETLANNLHLKFSKFLKRKYWDYQYELMCLNHAIAYLALKNVYSDPEENYDDWDDDAPEILGKIYTGSLDILFEVSFGSSSKYVNKKYQWVIATDGRIKRYFEKGTFLDSNTFHSMALLFLKNIQVRDMRVAS